MGAARVVTATSGATNIALAKTFGADVVIDYKVEDIFSALPDDSVDLVYDSTLMPSQHCSARAVTRSWPAPDLLACTVRVWCSVACVQITARKALRIERCPR